MDHMRVTDGDDVGHDYPAADEPVMDAPPSIGSDERRMHVRAYNYWVSLLRGRAYPSIDELHPETISDFGPHGVVLDLGEGAADPAIPFVGAALREEGGHEMPIRHVSDVPRGSLLSRLTDHIDEIVANHAPIGFEAEFVNQRGRNMMYRGILMPFSADQTEIDAIYGVINWKEAPDDAVARALSAEVAQALVTPPTVAAVTIPVWADGPNAGPQAGVAPADQTCDEPYDAPRYDASGALVSASEGVTVAWPGLVDEDVRAALLTVPALAEVSLTLPGEDAFVLLVGRRETDGRLSLLSTVEDPLLLDRALRRIAG